jgi:tRNA pseudouridine32 synthase/23S rRNA pseudouridine746 synthase/23S rRNA pseudouridine1911/1915/1917 synthase
MKIQKPVLAKKYRPRGFEILHEDLDIIVVDKQSGMLSVAALWNKEETVHSGLNSYLQKGNPRSTKSAFVVHRLDQATSGVLIFAKSEKIQSLIKANWSENKKIYFAIVYGKLKKTSGLIESFLEEDENYHVHSSQDKDKGKLARTEYQVVKETSKFSLVRLNLLTGKKNQIRVHMSELGSPIVGDFKYGAPGKAKKMGQEIMLHSYSLELTHPFKKERIEFIAKIPDRFSRIIDVNLSKIGESDKIDKLLQKQ